MAVIDPEDFKLNANLFLKNLVNLALVVKIYLTNQNKKTLELIEQFTTDSLGHGDTKLFITTDLPKVTEYEAKSTLLQDELPVASEEALRVNDRNKIHVTYNRLILDEVFTSDSGVTNYISYLLSQVESSRYDNLYDKLVNTIFTEDFQGTQLIPVNIDSLNGVTSAVEKLAIKQNNSEIIATVLQTYSQNMQVFSRNYNKLQYKQAVDKNDLVLIMNAKFANQQILNLSATLLNSKVINNEFEIPNLLVVPEIKIPQGNENVIGFMIHKRHLQLFYKLMVNYEFFDISNLHSQYFSHFHVGIGIVEGLPAIKLVANEIVAN